MMGQENKIIIMDDEVQYANFILDVAKTLNLDCTVTTTADDFMNLFNPNITLIFLDLNIPGTNGIDLLKFIESKQGKCDIILMSGVEDRIMESAEAFAKSINLSVVGRFQKTIRLAELESLLKKIVENSSSKIEKPIEQPKPKSEFTVSKEELMSAIQNNEFVAYYQPKIEIATRGLYGVEVLIRWLNSKQQLIFPDQFIPQAESYELIDEISWLIFKKAIKEMEDLQNKVQLPFKMALNLSALTLKDVQFPQKFIKLMEQCTLSPDKVILEITESGIINQLSNALEIFTRLRLSQIHLSIDDFGTGYAMMQQLKLIPANEIKIDKSFVQNIFVDNSSRVTVQKVIEIGHELGMKVVAEGVETKEQLQFLQSHRCDIAQGYLFSKPLSLTDLQSWIESHYGF